MKTKLKQEVINNFMDWTPTNRDLLVTCLKKLGKTAADRVKTLAESDDAEIKARLRELSELDESREVFLEAQALRFLLTELKPTGARARRRAMKMRTCESVVGSEKKMYSINLSEEDYSEIVDDLVGLGFDERVSTEPDEFGGVDVHFFGTPTEATEFADILERFFDEMTAKEFLGLDYELHHLEMQGHDQA